MTAAWVRPETWPCCEYPTHEWKQPGDGKGVPYLRFVHDARCRLSMKNFGRFAPGEWVLAREVYSFVQSGVLL